MHYPVLGGSESQWEEEADSPPVGEINDLTDSDGCGVWESLGDRVHGTGAGPLWKWSPVHHLETLSS